jgi:hypothetical protein
MCVVAVYKRVVARSANATPSSMGLIGIASGEAVIRANPCRLCRVSSTLLHKSLPQLYESPTTTMTSTSLRDHVLIYSGHFPLLYN